MLSAKSFASLTIALITLIFSVVLPLSAYAATEVSISSGNNSVTINGKQITSDNDDNHANSRTRIRITDDELDKDIFDDDAFNLRDKETPTPSPKEESIFPSSESARSLRATRTPTPTPTPRIRRMRTPTPTPTKKLTPTTTPTKTPIPSPTTAASGTTDEKQAFIINEINDYRRSKGLAEVKTDPYTCAFAKIRAKEITSGFNHDGFSNRISAKTIPYPSYHMVTENIAMTSDYKKVVTLWINSAGHAENMRRDTPFVCVESSGNYYAYEGWRP